MEYVSWEDLVTVLLVIVFSFFGGLLVGKVMYVLTDTLTVVFSKIVRKIYRK